MSHSHPGAAQPTGRYLFGLTLTALGVVYGDIGTSPLYAIRESFHPSHGIAASPENVLGVLSLILWSLILVISIKYLVFVVRADNRGEGGILALMALVAPPREERPGRRRALAALGIFGAALLYGDGMITPAISVLSAVEGLEVATPLFKPYIIPITIVILVALFAVQRRGTGGVGKVFGPVTFIWFVTLITLGVSWIVQAPRVLAAVNPLLGLDFFLRTGWHGYLVLGSVFLVVTGGEALYADMGHFGKTPIRLAWFALVLPALVINYFGQGALLLLRPETVENPFYLMAPQWALYPVVAIATAATVIASQALISGVFSITRQAVQLGYSPRVEIEHTSAQEIGQIYIPGINWALMISCIGLVIGFRSSSNLAAAYGVAVTTTMAITTILFYNVALHRWKWNPALVTALTGFFLVIDLAFFGANIIKVPHGGWFPLVVGALIYTLLATWKRGRQILAERMQASTLPIELFLQSLSSNPPYRVAGTAVFMTSNRAGTPPALLHSLKHYKVLHQQVAFLSIVTEEVSYVPAAERVEVEVLGEGIYRLVIHYGFTQDVNIPSALELVNEPGLDLRPMHTTFFLGRETLIATKNPGMALWRERLFALMSKNATAATSFFNLAPNRVVELGTQVEL